MYLKPCRHCPKYPCDRSQDALVAFREFRTTSARISCDVFRGLFPPGTRVTFELDLVSQDEYDYCTFKETFVGTVSKFREDKLRVFPDEHVSDDLGKKPRTNIRLHVDRLTQLDEPPWEICEDCGKPRDLAIEEWTCNENPLDQQTHPGGIAIGALLPF